MSEEYLLASCPNLNCTGHLEKNTCTECGIHINSHEEWTCMMESQMIRPKKGYVWQRKEFDSMFDLLDD